MGYASENCLGDGVCLKFIAAITLLVYCTIYGIQQYQAKMRQAEFNALASQGTPFLCMTFNGRLGNHMFQYASIFGISKLTNRTIIVGNDDDIVQYFEVPSAYIRHNRNVCQFFEKRLAKRCCHYEENITQLEARKHYMLGEYLQSWKYFRHAFEDVRKELRFRRPYRDVARSVIENYRNDHLTKTSMNATVVGVHLRRGDYASKRFIEDDNLLLTPDQYIYDAMDYFMRHFANVIFIVCSDDVEYAQKVIKHKQVLAKLVHFSPMQDLAILSACDHVLTTVGTFGWFAGFLSGGNVTYWKHPMREGSFSRSEVNYEDFFLPHWTGLGDPLPTRKPKAKSKGWLLGILSW